MINALIQGLDCILSGVTLLTPRKRALIIKEIEKEAELFGSKDGKQPDQGDVFPHLLTLLNVNHTRPAASISHTSLMLAALIFSYNMVFKASHILQTIILCEVVLYLMLAASLLRVVRHFGIQRPIFERPHQETSDNAVKYKRAILNELALKYQILHVTNFVLISGAIAFGGFLVFHLTHT